ncbi:MAG: hypothetical protein HZA94_01475 [Candidatus Vogelbacteria bacterium]|nr:hypothetical protein [Candidatus Vogelbacteria bacterium]
MRTKTVRRMFRRLEKAEENLPIERFRSAIASYTVGLKHCRARGLAKKIKEMI